MNNVSRVSIYYYLQLLISLLILLVRAVTVFVLVSLTTVNSHVLGMRAVLYWFETAIQNVFNLIVQIINLVVGTVELIQ